MFLLKNVKPFSSNECSECMQSGVYQCRIFPGPLHFYEHIRVYDILLRYLTSMDKFGEEFYYSIQRRVIIIYL